jgi:hypothetical protein
MQLVYKCVLSAVTLASHIALRLLVDCNLLVCDEYMYRNTLYIQ